ncbi:MAG TPA: methylmalonyl-CoA decarboxylase [Candidatus Limnocylindrales bacterium]
MRGDRNVSTAVESIAAVSEENSASAEQVSAATEELSAQATEVVTSAASLARMAARLDELLSAFQFSEPAVVGHGHPGAVVEMRRSRAALSFRVHRAHELPDRQHDTMIKRKTDPERPSAHGRHATVSSINIEIRDSVAWITLASPPVNALSMTLIDDLSEALVQYRPPDVRVVVIRAAAGSKVFSAGHDVHELPTNGRDPLTYNDPLRKVIRNVETYPAPIIAMVEGSVWGGACELVLSCDLVVAGSDVTFALTPARLGVPYNLSGTLNFMKVADMHFLKEMLFAARPIPATRMAGYGVVNSVVPVDQLEASVAALAKDIAALSPLVHRIMKEELRVLANAQPLTPEAYERIQALRREVYDSDDYQEGIKAFKEKRRPDFQGT